MLNYEELSEELQERINKEIFNGHGFEDKAIRRENKEHDKARLWRGAFVRDAEKIMHSPYYNRYADKTQVFSLYKNDDISHRALHVQLVSRISRNIGKLLGLDLDLIEAIALGHDIGHTPFGHAGERFLNELYNAETGRYFNHNVHSVRDLDKISPLNIRLQPLDGILCHTGEFECKEYRP
ncbi:MAG: HD domain-containing protein, partial [Clostridia bacterium]|nr:HD domain-containing protein [Clostridia bacterium]